MTEDFEYIEQIEAYLLNRMCEEEKQAFEAELKVNKALSEEYSVLSAFIEVVKENDSRALKEKLQIKKEELKSYEGKKGLSPFKLVAILIILIGIAVLLKYTVFNISTNEQIVREYRIKDPGVLVLLNDDSFNRDFNTTMSMYQKGDFEAAQPLFYSLLISNPRNDTLLFYEGISAFENKEYNIAKADFEWIISFENSEYYEKAEYWLGLSFLANNEKDQAKMIFEDIVKNPSHIYYDKATKILSEKVFKE